MATKSTSLLDSRVIRVFISSTFRDMQDERDELMKKTFPVLRRKAAERDVTLTELDLRWGITPEESESGKVVEICLREIENSVPFFIGIIGNRYGWIPSPGDLDESLRERFSQVDGYVERKLSVTEMEMQFGVLERVEDMHAFFFIKEQEADDVDEPEKLVALKAAVRSNGRYPVASYSSPEDLAGQVEAAFTKLLDELYPEGALSELDKERIGQRAYLNSLCQNYIRTDANFAVIDEWMQDWEKHQLVIIGASGLGKSALAANWVKEKLNAGAELPYQIIYHFVGNGGSLGSHGHVIKALCDEIRNKYGFETNERESKTDEKALEELFNQVAAEGDKPLLIVLDAINQIIDIDNSKQLNWLPIPPKKVKILFTTLEDDQTMDVFKNRQYPMFKLQPLTKTQREEMVRGYLSIFSKKLQPCQVDRIVNDKQCENTLVLKTLLDELVNFGIFEKLDEKIATYLGTSSVEEFYGILLKGYEIDFGELFVKHILSLIAVSRNGLSEEEILAITKETPLHWSQFFCAIHQHLIVKNGLISFAHSHIRKAVEDRYLQGEEGWSNACRKEIVSSFNDAKTHRAMDELPYQYWRMKDIGKLAQYLETLDVVDYLLDKGEFLLIKLCQSVNEVLNRNIFEVQLKNVIEIPVEKRSSFLVKVSDFTRVNYIDLAFSLECLYLAEKFSCDDIQRASILNKIGMIYGRQGALYNPNKEEEYYRKAYQIRLLAPNLPVCDLAESYNNLGSICYSQGEYDRAMFYFRDAYLLLHNNMQKNHEMEDGIAITLSNMSSVKSMLGKQEEALELAKQSLEYRLRMYGESHPDVADSYQRIGIIYKELRDYKKACEKASAALLIRSRLYGEYHPDTLDSYNDVGGYYGELGDYEKELEFLSKALEINLSLYGEDCFEVARLYNNIGAAEGKLGNLQKEIEYKKRALEIAINIAADDLVATLYNRVGRAYAVAGQKEIANDYFRKAAQKFRELGDEDQVVASQAEILE